MHRSIFEHSTVLSTSIIVCCTLHWDLFDVQITQRWGLDTVKTFSASLSSWLSTNPLQIHHLMVKMCALGQRTDQINYHSLYEHKLQSKLNFQKLLVQHNTGSSEHFLPRPICTLQACHGWQTPGLFSLDGIARKRLRSHASNSIFPYPFIRA